MEDKNILRESATEILVVEDNVYSAYALMSILDQYQLNYALVLNGDQAIEAVKHRHYSNSPPFQLIVMDLILPSMNGFEVTREILKFYSQKGITPSYFALLSGNVTETVRQQAIKIGMRRVIQKPIFKAGV